MWHLPDPVQLATPLFILLVIVEMLFVRFTGRGKFETWDTAASLMMGFGSVVVPLLFAVILFRPHSAFNNLILPYRLFDIGWSWSAIAVCFGGLRTTFVRLLRTKRGEKSQLIHCPCTLSTKPSISRNANFSPAP